jgi:hypothetical protein
MAVSSTSYFSNAFPAGNLHFPGDVFSSDTDPRFALGFKVVRADGAEFVYSHFGAASAAGTVVAQDLSESSVVDTDNVVIAPASAASVPGESVQPGAVGSTYVQLTLASVTADQFAGGYLSITDDTGEGYTYRIAGNTATNDPVTGDIRLTLKDRIKVALDATSDIAITGCLYANLEPATQAVDEVVAGVTVAVQAAADYGFVQTKGVASVLTDGVLVISDAVTTGSVAGSVAAVAAFTDHVIGQVIAIGDDTGHSAINLSV